LSSRTPAALATIIDIAVCIAPERSMRSSVLLKRSHTSVWNCE
jgi:hypothetical protein